MGMSVIRATNRRGVRRVPMARRVQSQGVRICRVPLPRIPTPIRGVQPRNRLRHSNPETHNNPHSNPTSNRLWRITRVGFMPLRSAATIPYKPRVRRPTVGGIGVPTRVSISANMPRTPTLRPSRRVRVDIRQRVVAPTTG